MIVLEQFRKVIGGRAQTALPTAANAGDPVDLMLDQYGRLVLAANPSIIIGKVGIDQTTPGTTNKVSIGTDGVLASGSSIIGKVGIDQTTPGTTNGVSVNNVVACRLSKGGTVCELVTCTAADTDYAGAGAMPAGTKYVVVSCAALCTVAMGAATSTTNGVDVVAGMPTTFPATVTGTTADDTVHVRTAAGTGASTLVKLSYMKD